MHRAVDVVRTETARPDRLPRAMRLTVASKQAILHRDRELVVVLEPTLGLDEIRLVHLAQRGQDARH
jgi:hypothetical protein